MDLTNSPPSGNSDLGPLWIRNQRGAGGGCVLEAVIGWCPYITNRFLDWILRLEVEPISGDETVHGQCSDNRAGEAGAGVGVKVRVVWNLVCAGVGQKLGK